MVSRMGGRVGWGGDSFELRGGLDLDTPSRDDPGALAGRRADPRARAVLIRHRQVATTAFELDLVPMSSVPQAALAVYLGRAAPPGQTRIARGVPDEPLWAVAVEDETLGRTTALEGATGAGADADSGRSWTGLRQFASQAAPEQATWATTAVAILEWHAREPRCPRCGGPTTVEQGSWSRRCPRDASVRFPRVEPAVIVAVLDEDDRLLLAHNRAWPAGRRSLLAGFVEAGESLEEAAHREIREECGIQIGALTYASSQAWPFPASLMVALWARARRQAIAVDGDEIAEASWFDRDSLRAALHGGEVLLPDRSSIARRVIEVWLAG